MEYADDLGKVNLILIDPDCQIELNSLISNT